MRTSASIGANEVAPLAEKKVASTRMTVGVSPQRQRVDTLGSGVGAPAAVAADCPLAAGAVSGVVAVGLP